MPVGPTALTMNSFSPVDIVYLWVDGDDTQWRSRRRLALQQLKFADHVDMAAYSNVEGRFRDNDELRYSLRSLEQFFPGHGHVYLVTDRQTPTWLRRHPGLTVIDHRELMPECALPNFDSGNIESYIHLIPGLSERYIYFNDDVFLGAPLDLKKWFFEGGVYVGWSDDAPVSDVALQPGAAFHRVLPDGHTAFVYVYEGGLNDLPAHGLAVLGRGDEVQLVAGGGGARFILGAGKPIGEPIVQHGPFVMNTREEIEQAFRDYQSGKLVQKKAVMNPG